MDLLETEVVADPYPTFARYREVGPVHWSDTHRAWVVLGHEAVKRGVRHPGLSSERHIEMLRGAGADHPGHASFPRWMVFRDAPVHSRLRSLVAKAFTPRVVERLAPRVQSVVDECLDLFQKDGGGDFVSGFAFPLPAIVIAELLGAAPEDRPLFRRCSEAVAALVFREAGSGRHGRSREGLEELNEYFRVLVEAKRRDPGEDLISQLIAVEEAGDLLDTEELIATCIMILIAGHETTASLLASSVLAFERYPAQRDRLRSERDVLPSAVEELLRFEGPAKMIGRVARADLELSGVAIPSGARVLLVLSAANRDPLVFDDPETLELGRQPNPHLAFGFGEHFCLGAHLARLEMRVALRTLYERCPGLRVTTERPQWRRTLVTRTLERLPVAL
jgi:cytochrome P450